VIAQHGYRGNRESLLFEGIALNERGYNVLLTTSRAHDQNKGGQITFGAHEMKDLEAWYQYLLTRIEVDPDKIGIMGESMGGGMAILYAAQNDNIKTVATASAFTLSVDAVENFIFQDVARPGPVAPIFAQMMVYWAETNANFNSANLDTARAVAEIGPRPILILHGGQDKVVSPQNGMELSEAAGGTAQFEIFPNVEHCTFDEVDPDHYVEILADFFDRSLLAT